jgi:hypothetical protein
MGIHDHRFRLQRAVREAYGRMAGAAYDIERKEGSLGHASRWPKLVIAFGAVVTLLWMAVLIWFVLRVAVLTLSWING